MKALTKGFQFYFISTALLAAVILVWTVYHTKWTGDAVVNLLVFGVLAVVSESMPVALPKGGYVTVTYAIVLSSVVLFPLGITLLVVAMAGFLVFGKSYVNEPFYKRILSASLFVVSVAFTYSIMGFTSNKVFVFNLQWVITYIITALIYLISNITIVTIAIGMIQKKSPWSIWLSNIKWAVPNFLALAPLGMLLALIYKSFGIWGLFLLFIPLLLSRHSFQLYIELRENYLNTVEALVQALEAKDTYTSGHSSRVGKLVSSLASEMNLSEEKMEFLKYASVLHDVGKIGVSEFILNKNEKLLDSEWESIRNHPVIGQKIIKKIKFMFDIGQVTRHHHERYDGNGYPDGLKGELIPLESRVIAVADTYDAMTSDRSYRKGRTHEEAVTELRRVAGTQLDPKLVEIFCKVLSDELSAQSINKGQTA
ncbi:MAG: HD-GYP domain-containing protein [Desulfitobacteriaceae bacterium]